MSLVSPDLLAEVGRCVKRAWPCYSLWWANNASKPLPLPLEVLEFFLQFLRHLDLLFLLEPDFYYAGDFFAEYFLLILYSNCLNVSGPYRSIRRNLV